MEFCTDNVCVVALANDKVEKGAHDKADQDAHNKAENKKAEKKFNGKGGRKCKADVVKADNVNTDISSLLKSKKSQGWPSTTISEMAPDASSGLWHSVHTEKGENPNNYKLASGKYKSK